MEEGHLYSHRAGRWHLNTERHQRSLQPRPTLTTLSSQDCPIWTQRDQPHPLGLSNPRANWEKASSVQTRPIWKIRTLSNTFKAYLDGCSLNSMKTYIAETQAHTTLFIQKARKMEKILMRGQSLLLLDITRNSAVGKARISMYSKCGKVKTVSSVLLII